MAEVKVRNLKNRVVDQLSLSERVFDYQASETLAWEAVNAYRAGQRKGTHAAKTRGLVRGSGRKPWRQKGTGRARIGSIRSPLWRKGGTVFGPQPRDHAQAFPKKKRRGAIRLVLTDKFRTQKLVVVEGFPLENHKTRSFLEVLKSLKLSGKVLVVDGRENRNLYLSCRNLAEVKMVPTEGVNIFDLLNCEHLLISRNALLELTTRLEK